MFSIAEKRSIADQIQKILRDTNHCELPDDEIEFTIHINGRYHWSYADIKNNGNCTDPTLNPWNEAQHAKNNPRTKK